MLEFVANLKKEVDAKIEQIEASDDNILKKSLAGSQILAEAFNRLKIFVLTYTFKMKKRKFYFLKILSRSSVID